MSNKIAVKRHDGTMRIVADEEVNTIYDMMEGLGGEEALALTMAAWNIEGSVNMDEVKDAVTDFFTNVYILRKAIGRMLRGEEV